MLGNLDNDVIFKKAFTDPIVFKAFVKDILGLDIEVDKIETEKRFEPKIGNIDFKLDIYAESIDKRIIIEIQRVEYDHNFDRFLNYFLMVIAEQQRNSKDYSIKQTVYAIVVLTAKYKLQEKNGQAVLDEVLLLNLNPKTLKGLERNIYGHQMVCLNPNYKDTETPASIRDWLELVYQSIYNRENPILNQENLGIKRAVQLIDYEQLSPEERSEAKKTEMARVSKMKEIEYGRMEGKKEEKIAGIKKAILRGKLTLEEIAEDFEVELDFVLKIKNGEIN
jgi:PD-(D/E)XK nuclease family transposase